MKTIYKMFIFLAALSFSLCFAQINETKLIPSDGLSSDGFGYSVASDGNYMIIGAVYSDSLGLNSGSAYIYENIGGVWTEKSRILPSDGTTLQHFGISVSISGDFALVGAYLDAQNGLQAGAAYIFQRDSSGEWIELTKLLPADGSAYDQFGYAVSIWGDYAIVGALFDHVNSVETGSAYIFKWDGTTWTEQAKLLAENGVGTPQFGNSVSIYGDYAIVGAYDDEELGSHVGAAYIFHFDGIDWVQQVKLNASDASLNHYFGHSVSICGDYAVVGSSAALTTTGGAAFIFHRDGTDWNEEAMVEGSSNFTHSSFGLSVSIDGDYIIVGAPDEDTNGNHAGCAYIFKRDGTAWVEQTMVIASDGTEGDKMGWSVFIEGDQALAGAPIQESGGVYCGAAYVYSGFVTGVNENAYSSARDFHLEQNYPNPFNPQTKISWESPVNGWQILKVYNILGKEVATLVNEYKPAGKYTIEFSASGLPSGVYLYRIQTGGFVETKKMVVLR
jgi:hypothetical protein